MAAKESKGRRLTDIEALLILSTNDNLFQTAKRIDEYFEAKSKEEAEERLELGKAHVVSTYTPAVPQFQRIMEALRLAAFGKEGEG